MLKQALVAVSLLTISLPFYSQEVTVNKPKYGFTVGINRSNIEHNIKNVISQNDRIGLRLGVLAEFQLVKGLYFMPKAELSFNRGSLTYLEPNLFLRDYEIIPIGLEGKFNLAYKFREGKTLQPFILGGASYIQALEGKKESFEYSVGSTFAVEAGIGIERKFDHFIFAPELRYSRGLNNVNDNPIFYGNVYFHNFVVALVFKG